VASSLDLADYDGVVCVSGDGVLVEVSDTSRSLMSEFFNK
jgi:diacylglycerol kinase family enzyme